MEDITTLLSRKSSLNERMTIANNIIAQYDLPFSVDNIITMTERSVENFNERVATHFVHLLLTTNVRMFIAVTYAILDNKMMNDRWVGFLFMIEATRDTLGRLKYGKYRLGCPKLFDANDVQQVYCALHDYYEFDISNLVLPELVRDLIQKYIDCKVSYVKKAIKK